AVCETRWPGRGGCKQFALAAIAHLLRAALRGSFFTTDFAFVAFVTFLAFVAVVTVVAVAAFFAFVALAAGVALVALLTVRDSPTFFATGLSDSSIHAGA